MATVTGPLEPQHSITETAPVVDSLVPHARGRLRTVASQVLGLSGLILLSFLCCFGAGAVTLLSSSTNWDDEFVGVAFTTTVLLTATVCYVTTLLALHTIASSLLPLSLRLALIFAVIYVCLRLATWPTSDHVQALHVIMLMPFCFGSFFQRHFRRWRSLALNQIPHARPLTISVLMDVTTAAALTLTVLTSAVQWTDVGPVGLLVFVPSSVLMGVIGMLCWSRLCVLCPISTQAESGNGIWLAINQSNAFFVLIGFLAIYSQSRLVFLAFIVAPLTVLVAHIGTEIPIRWLRGCGWTFARIEQS